MIAPSIDHRRSLEQVLFVYDHRVEVGGLGEQFSGSVADTRGADVAVNVRLSDTFRLSGRGQWQRKFGRKDERAGGGLEWRLRSNTGLIASGLVGDDNSVLPENEGYVAIGHVRQPAEWTLGFRSLDFLGARASAIEPSLSWLVSDRVTLDLRLALVFSQLASLPWETNRAARVRVSYGWLPRMSVVAGYARGIEDFDAVSIDRIGAFQAHTLSGGARVSFLTLTSLFAGYEYQWRSNSVDMQRVSVALTQRF